MIAKFLFVALIFALASSALAARNGTKVARKPITLPQKIGDGDETCDLCLQSMVQYINVLLNEGIGEGTQDCHELCSPIPKGYERDLCDYTCGVVGLAAMMEVLEKDGKDIIGLIIYACGEIYACPVSDCQGTCVNITSYQIHPPQASIDATFNNVVYATVLKPWTGTGMVRCVVTYPDGSTFEFGDYMIYGGLGPVGTNKGMNIPIHACTIFFPAVFIPHLAPNHGFKPGNSYKTKWQICNGQCDGPFPHDAILATAYGKFSIMSGPTAPLLDKN